MSTDINCVMFKFDNFSSHNKKSCWNLEFSNATVSTRDVLPDLLMDCIGKSDKNNVSYKTCLIGPFLIGSYRPDELNFLGSCQSGSIRMGWHELPGLM